VISSRCYPRFLASRIAPFLASPGVREESKLEIIDAFLKKTHVGRQESD
jgi:hypothetical protein